MKHDKAIHLLLFGALLAGILFLAVGPPGSEEPGRQVRFTRADVAQVFAQYERTWGRPPQADQLRSAFERYVREEILYREALARGLDRGDAVVRQTLVRKVTLLGSAVADLREPNEADIRAYFALRKERYRVPGSTSIRQIVIDPTGHDDLQAHLRKLQATLNEGDPRPEELARMSSLAMLPTELSEEEVADRFDAPFQEALGRLEPGTWVGPIESGYGLHLVKVVRRKASRIPDLSEVRTRVLGDMQFEARRAAGDQLYAELAARYQIEYDDDAAAALRGKAR